MKSHALTSILAVLALAAAPSLVTAQTNIFPASGNAGIGTTSPSHKLDVLGDINISATSAYMYNGTDVIIGDTTLHNFFFGAQSGNLSMTGYYDTGIGFAALYNNSLGIGNTAIGASSLYNNTTGNSNTAVGYASICANTTGANNSALGYCAGRYISDGSVNQASGNSLYLGVNTKANASGDTNEIVIGFGSVGIGSNTAVFGNSSTVKTALFGNVGIGTTTPQQKLHVAGMGRFGADTNGYVEIGSQPAEGGWINLKGCNDLSMFLEGDNGYFRLLSNNWKKELFRVDQSGDVYMVGNVGIGTGSPTYPLTVNGAIRAKEVIVDTGWSDFVFEDNYNLRPLAEVERQIKEEKHLDGIPSAQQVAARGVSVGDMQSKLIQKVEELTLYLIQLKHENDDLKARITALERK